MRPGHHPFSTCPTARQSADTLILCLTKAESGEEAAANQPRCLAHDVMIFRLEATWPLSLVFLCLVSPLQMIPNLQLTSMWTKEIYPKKASQRWLCKLTKDDTGIMIPEWF